MEIRTARRDDAPGLKKLDTVVPGDPGRGAWIDQWLREGELIVAEREGRVVGYGVFNHRFFRQGQVEMLMVDRAFRRQGVGTRILARLEALCDSPRLFVTTNRSNHPMQALLRGMDYRPGGSIHVLSIPETRNSCS